MSSRERWTVYPLLFLTLGIALKDKVTRMVSTDQVLCKQILVTDRQGMPQVIVASNSGGGVIHARGTNQSPDVILGHFNQLNGLMFSDASGRLVRPGLAFRSPPPPAPRAPVVKQPAEAPPASSRDDDEPAAPQDD